VLTAACRMAKLAGTGMLANKQLLLCAVCCVWQHVLAASASSNRHLNAFLKRGIRLTCSIIWLMVLGTHTIWCQVVLM
jgi:hypothetical protein